MDEKQLDALAGFHREREEWQREQQKLRQKAEAEWEFMEPSKPLRYRVAESDRRQPDRSLIARDTKQDRTTSARKM